MYIIPDIRTSYYPQRQGYNEARAEVREYADKLAKERGYTDYDVWIYKTYGWKWNIEITDNSGHLNKLMAKWK